MAQLLAKKTFRKWLLLIALALLVYGSGWVLGTRQFNAQNPINATMDAGENEGAAR